MKTILVAVLMALGGLAHAQFDNTILVYKGQYMDVTKVSASSTTGSTVLSADESRLDAIVFNNAPNAVWIGTTSAALHNTQHSNITLGFPITSSGTVRLEGKMGDVFYVTCSNGIVACDVRILNYKLR